MNRKPWNPLHAAALGAGSGSVLFGLQLLQAEAWRNWPDPQLFESSLTLLVLLAFSFALIALARNRRVGC